MRDIHAISKQHLVEHAEQQPLVELEGAGELAHHLPDAIDEELGRDGHGPVNSLSGGSDASERSATPSFDRT